MKKSVKKTVVFLLKILFVAAIFYWILSKIDVEHIGQLLRRVKLAPIIVALGFFLINRLLATIKWSILLKKNGLNEKLFDLLRTTFVSGFVGSVLPAGVGPDLVRLLQVGKRQGNYTAVAGCVVADRLIATIVLCMVSLIGVIASLQYNIARQHLMIVAIIAVSLFMVSSFFFTGSALRFFSIMNSSLKKISQKLPCRINMEKFTSLLQDKAQSIHSALAGPFKDRKTAILVMFINFLVQIFRVIQVHFLFMALSASPPLTAELALVPVIILITMLPVSPFLGIGLKEGAFVYFFAAVNVPAEVALSASLLSHIVTITGLMPGGFMFFFPRHKKDTSQ